MSPASRPSSKPPIDPKRPLTYRGVTLQRPAARSHFTIAEIKKAVEDAIAENSEALATIR